MSDPIVTTAICDEFLVSLTGKLNIFGIYTGDIAITSDEQKIAQMVVVFHVECDLATPPRVLTAEVRFPGEPVIQNNIPVVGLPPAENRPKWIIRWPILMIQPTLRPGRIETRLVHDRGTVEPAPHLVVRAMTRHSGQQTETRARAQNG